jgi:nucleoside-diphosphate-sugar epimerase
LLNSLAVSIIDDTESIPLKMLRPAVTSWLKLGLAAIVIQDTRVPRPDYLPDKPIDLTRSRKELGYEPMYNMPKAIEDLFESRRQIPK